jgi:hypothetical protein
MTRSTAKELPRNGSLDQNPPLYQKLKPILPPPWAAPTEVADFLVRLLVANNVPVDRATCIAAKWTLGSGKELRDYPAVMYLDIFEKEDAWATYPAVQQAVHDEKSKDFWYRNEKSKHHKPGRRRTSYEPS